MACLVLLVTPLSAYAGLQAQILVNYAGGSRFYDLYVPDTPSAQPRPLVIDMHGRGRPANDQRRRSAFPTLAESEQFIVAWPEGGWNSYFGVGGSGDVDAVRAIVNHIASNHSVDQKRVYATGWSQGGEMAYRLACEASDVFAAVASVAGGVLEGTEPNCRPLRPVSTISFRGLEDGVTPYNGGWVSLTMDTILSASATHDFWKDIDGCSGADQSTAIGSASCNTNSQCSGNVRVTSCTVTGGGEPVNHNLYSAAGIDISKESWNFFKAFTLTELQSSIPINPGLSDSWYDPATAGQGFFIVVLEQTGIIFMAWFTFDTELPPPEVVAQLGAPGQRWVTAQGPYNGGKAVLDVYNTAGGVFDASEPVPQTGAPIGTITIEWTDCEHGLLSYDLSQPMVSGQIPIQRIVSDNVPLCEAFLEQQVNSRQQGAE